MSLIAMSMSKEEVLGFEVLKTGKFPGNASLN